MEATIEPKGKNYSAKITNWGNRLLQNRKSAMKCRLKKKDEIEKIKIELQEYKELS